MTQGANKTCEACGSEITADQIVRREAGLVGGALLCPKCVAGKREELLEARNAALRAQAQASPTPEPAPALGAAVAQSGDSEGVGPTQGAVWMPPVTDGMKDEADESLTLVSEQELASSGSTKIRSFAEGSTLAGAHKETGFNRPLAGVNEPATRCRTFHGKLTQAGLGHMDEQINEWLDAHPDIYIKTSSSSVGIFEGKNKEPHLLLTLFY